MTKPFEEWTVLPHGKLSQIDDDILTVQGNLPMPLVEFPRRMTVVRLQDRDLVVFSAISLDPDEMVALEAFGWPSYLVVPNEIHRMDAKAWKHRYPNLTVVAPAGVKEKVQKIVSVNATSVDFGDPRVRFVTVPGTNAHESALEVETRQGLTLVLNDLIWNVATLPGFGGWLFELFGLTGPIPKMTAPVRLTMVKDRKALAAKLHEWATRPDLRRIIVSHGEIVTFEPSRTLSQIADKLAA